MMAADYRHIGGLENRLGRHYSRFSPFLPAPALASQSLALRKLCDAGSNRRRRARLAGGGRWIRTIGPATDKLPPGAPCDFRARLHQLGEALIPRGTKSS